MRTYLPHRQRNRLLGIAAAAVAALSLSPAAQANTGQVTTARLTTVAVRQAGTPPAGKGLQSVPLPAMAAATATVTLPTGEKVRLTRAGADRYTVTADPGDPSAGSIVTVARGGPHGASSLLTIPAAADALVASGARRAIDAILAIPGVRLLRPRLDA